MAHPGFVTSDEDKARCLADAASASPSGWRTGNAPTRPSTGGRARRVFHRLVARSRDFARTPGRSLPATPCPAGCRTPRRARTPDDNRVTHGCINVAPEFYEGIIRPTFERGGVFYILPDTASLAETFPEFVQSRATAQSDEGMGASAEHQ